MRPALALCAVLSLAAWGGSLWLGDRLPDPMPIHWGLGGAVDGWMQREQALLLGPVLGFGVPAMVAGLIAVGGQREELEASGAVGPLLGLLGVFGVGVHGVVVLAALNPAQALADRGLLLLVAALTGALGALMPRLPRNGVVGVRTPLTLSSEAVWAATHRAAAWTMIGGAGAAALSALLLPAPWHVAGALVAILAGAVAPIPWSHVVARRR